jgi:4-hydroxybenzoate polyprenyltransferase
VTDQRRRPPQARRAGPPRPPAAAQFDYLPRLARWLKPAQRERLDAYLQLIRFDRPVGWLLLLWPCWWGLWIAAKGTPPIGTLVIFTLGVWLTRSGGCIANDLADRWLDPQVARTQGRPLATGRVSRKEALLLLAGLMLVAFGLVLLTNRLTVYLSFGALALALSYPYLKRWTYLPQVYLGAAFGMSIPMAFAAVTNSLPPLCWLLFVANVLWSTGYDTLYAMVDRDDDLKAGAKSTAILFGDLDLVAVGVLYASFLLAMGLAGQRAGLGQWYAAGWGLALLVSGWQLWLARSREPPDAFRAFRMAHFAGLALWAGIVVDLAAG